MLSNLFINPIEKRLRAGWRLILQGLLYFGGTILISLVIGIIAGILLVMSGADIQDSEVLMSVLDHPLARVFSTLASLGVIFLSYFIASRWIDRRPFRDYGFHLSPAWWIDFGFGLFLGAFLMLVIFAIELAAGWITISGYFQSLRPGTNFWVGILAYLVVFLCVGIYEEMLSRGYQLKNLAEGLNLKFFNPRIALLLSYFLTSTYFGWLHAGNPNATTISTINLMVAGLFLGLGYLLTGELAIPISLHITWNFFQGNVFGFPVSGMQTAASFIAIEQAGPELWTGGAFGPEAGLVGLVAIALGSLMIIGWVKWRHGSAAPRDAISIYQPRNPQPVPPVESAPVPAAE